MAGGCEELSDNKLRSTSVCSQSKKSTSNKKDTKDCGKSKPRNACSEFDSGKDAFGRKPCPKKSKQKECHESRKRFFDIDNKKCKSEKDENKCEEPKKETKCEDPKKEEKCEDTFKKVEEEDECKDTPKEEQSECTCSSSTLDDESSGCQPQKEITNGCGEVVESSKKSEHLGKKYVDVDDCLKMPEPKVMTVKPCLPRVEKSISCKKSKVSCISTDNCPHSNQLKIGKFFCIDARNKKMNECIKQYMKTDPNQISFQCAQFMKKRIHTVTQPPEASCGYPKLPTLPPPSRAEFLPPKPRQLLGRWAPTAGLYVATTAVVATWLTEWDAILKHIPFYRPNEEVSQPSIPIIGRNEGNGESTPSIASDEGNGENPSSIAKEGNGENTSS